MAWEDPDEKPAPVLPAAPLQPRVTAGLLDGLTLAFLALVLFLAPIPFGGVGVPAWAALAAIIGYAVVPLWAYQATPFMWLFGLELVGRDGQPPDPIDIVFREILGRGLGPAAYLVTFAFALIGELTGSVGISSSLGGIGLSLAALGCLGALALAVFGHFLALVSPDRRTLADLIARTVVIPRATAAVAQDLDAEEADYRRSQRRLRLRNVLLFEGALGVAMVAGPIIMTKAPAAQRAAYAHHLTLETDQRHFDADPSNASLAETLSADYERQGDPDKAAQVMARQQAAEKVALAKRETALRAAVAADPKNDDASDALIDFLEDHDRAADARAVREAAFEADPSPEGQASYGLWLYQRDAAAEAVANLSAALDAGFEAADAHAYLGLALRELGRKEEARRELRRSLEIDPELDGVEDELSALDEELGPEAKPKATPRPPRSPR